MHEKHSTTLIPASTGDGDRVPGLLDGWHGWLRYLADDCTYRDVAIFDDTIVGLDATRPEVRCHVVDVLGRGVKCKCVECERCVRSGGLCMRCRDSAPPQPDPLCADCDGTGWIVPSYDLRWALSWGTLTPDISAEESAGILACSVARIRAGLGPVVGIAERDGMAGHRTGAFRQWHTAAYVMHRGYATRGGDGTLTLPTY